jgi:hypothetical protein
VPPPTPLSAKRTTKSDVSTPDRWICAISGYSIVACALRSSPNDRSDAPSPDPKRSPPSKLPRTYTRLQKDLPVCQRASRMLPRIAVVVIHALPCARRIFPLAGTHQQHLPRAPTRSSTLWRVRYTGPIKLWRVRLHAPTCLLAREMHVLRSHQAFAHAIHAPSVPLPHTLTDACTTCAKHSSSLFSFHVSSRELPCQP